MLSLGSTLKILVCWAQGGTRVSSQGWGRGWGGEGWAEGGVGLLAQSSPSNHSFGDTKSTEDF